MFCPNFNKLFEFLVYTLLKTEFSKKTIDGKEYVLLEIKNPDGTRDGDIRVYEWKNYTTLREGGLVDPIGILVNEKIQKI